MFKEAARCQLRQENYKSRSIRNNNNDRFVDQFCQRRVRNSIKDISWLITRLPLQWRDFFSRPTNHCKWASPGFHVAPRCLNPKWTRSANAMTILPHYYVFYIFQLLYSPLNSEVSANKGESWLGPKLIVNADVSSEILWEKLEFHKTLHIPLQVSQYSSSIRALNGSNKGSLQVKPYLLQIINLIPKLNTALITGLLISHVFIDHFHSWNEALKHVKISPFLQDDFFLIWYMKGQKLINLLGSFSW